MSAKATGGGRTTPMSSMHDRLAWCFQLRVGRGKRGKAVYSSLTLCAACGTYEHPYVPLVERLEVMRLASRAMDGRRDQMIKFQASQRIWR